MIVELNFHPRDSVLIDIDGILQSSFPRLRSPHAATERLAAQNLEFHGVQVHRVRIESVKLPNLRAAGFGRLGRGIFEFQRDGVPARIDDPLAVVEYRQPPRYREGLPDSGFTGKAPSAVAGVLVSADVRATT